MLGASKSEPAGDSASKYVVTEGDGEQSVANVGETDALMGMTGEDKAAEKAAILAKMGGHQAKKADEIIDKCLDCCVQKCPEKCCHPMHFPWGYEGQPLKLCVSGCFYLCLFCISLDLSFSHQPVSFPSLYLTNMQAKSRRNEYERRGQSLY